MDTSAITAPLRPCGARDPIAERPLWAATLAEPVAQLTVGAGVAVAPLAEPLAVAPLAPLAVAPPSPTYIGPTLRAPKGPRPVGPERAPIGPARTLYWDVRTVAKTQVAKSLGLN